ncbi:MerR family transcriptional regulator [Fodinicola feengrottensis]|uniref:MerR family transcriptional regulator n=1 Tax=Fodinicola feengrottensis TaxID=435914 RepID=UPI002442B760|nr:MerR family transcriptional regulator [Fodinicola feengrottensis]
MITIGQLAASAGCTVKAVRHYHERGLLPEPERDASGYRRYGAEHAIALIKIRTLAEAGVPLSRVKELLAAGEDQFAAAIADIESTLRTRIRRLERTRQQVARLRAATSCSCRPRSPTTCGSWRNSASASVAYGSNATSGSSCTPSRRTTPPAGSPTS